ncbi:MAG: NAD(P)-dependent oxidoreductase [Phycisphaeraceae bacterium]
MMTIRTLMWVGCGRPRSDFIRDADFVRLKQLGSVRCIETAARGFTPQDVVHESRGAQAIITTWGTPAYPDDVLAQCQDLAFFGCVGGSVRGRIGATAWQRGIHVVTAVQAQGIGMAEQTLTLMLALLHRLPRHILTQAADVTLEHDGANRRGLNHRELLGCRVGLIGFGSIAQHLVRMLGPFDAQITAFDPYLPDDVFNARGVQRVDSVEALCAQADVVSIHAARLPETRGILSRAAIGRLRPGAAVINTAFADLMDLDAITERVQADTLHVAMDNLDVLGEANHSKIASLRHCPNCLITPVTFPSTDGVARMGRLVIDELERFARGQPLEHAVADQVLATRA